MKNFIIYASLLLGLLVTKVTAQEVKVTTPETTFEVRVKLIANKIEAITKEEIDGFKILVPNQLIAKSFNDKLTKVLNMVEIKISNINKLDELKNLLLSKLATIEN